MQLSVTALKSAIWDSGGGFSKDDKGAIVLARRGVWFCRMVHSPPAVRSSGIYCHYSEEGAELQGLSPKWDIA